MGTHCIFEEANISGRSL